MATHEDYDLPKSWPAADVLQWIKSTLSEADVTSVEIIKDQDGGLVARVWKQ